MVDSPFSQEYDEGKFYTQSSDKHHHSERIGVRIPSDWLRFLGKVSGSDLFPDIESLSDHIRDCLAHGTAVRLRQIGDASDIAAWNSRLALMELAGKQANDDRDMEVANGWTARLQAGHGWIAADFFRDAATLRNPNAVAQMANLARIYNLDQS